MIVKIMKILVLVPFLAGALSLSGCNTVEGAGQDIENTGEAIQGSAH